MSKQEIIDWICEINKTADPKHLANFSVEELSDYLNYILNE